MVGYDEQDPTVNLTVAEGDLSGEQTLTAEADDNVEISKVEFFVGDQMVGEDTEAPYEVTFDTTQFADGDYTISAVATDFVGNTAESSESRTLQNDGDGTTPTDGGDGGDDDDDGFPWWGWLLIFLVIAGIIVGAAVYQQKNKA